MLRFAYVMRIYLIDLKEPPSARQSPPAAPQNLSYRFESYIGGGAFVITPDTNLSYRFER